MRALIATASIVVFLIISIVATLFSANSVIAAVLCLFGWTPAILALGVATGRFIFADKQPQRATTTQRMPPDLPIASAGFPANPPRQRQIKGQ